MSLNITISDISIPESAVVDFPVSDERIEFEGKIIPDSYTVKIDNTDPTVYDDRYSGSLFYGAGFLGDPFTAYDDDLGRYIFTGLVKNVKVDEQSDVIEVEATSYIDDLNNTVCVYSNAADKTPAECVYEILTDVVGIDPSIIIDAGFNDAIAYQDSESVYVNVTFTAEDKKPCLQVVNELLRICQCHIYTKQNLIYMYQWREYNGEQGFYLYPRNITVGSYSHEFDDSRLFTSYSVCYDNAGSIAFATGGTTTGKEFSVPDEEVDKTDTVDFKINLRNSTGAAFAGALAISRFGYIRKTAKLEIEGNLNFIELGDVINFKFSPFYGEPARIIGRKYDRNTNKIDIEIEYLNTPQGYYTRDVEPPAAPELVDVISIDSGAVILKWTMSQEADWLGYKIYFTTTPGEWERELCHVGRSPIDNKSTTTTKDGYIYAYMAQLAAGAKYYFRVSAYDTSYNESDKSNIISIRVGYGESRNIFRLAGGAYSDGLTLDRSNPLDGLPIDDSNTLPWTLPVTLYPAAHYTSGVLRDIDSVTVLSDGDVYYQIRTSSDGTTWSSWSNPAAIGGNVTIDFTDANYCQYRFLFYSARWSDSDYVFIKKTVRVE